MITSDNVIYSGFNKYISTLYKNEFFKLTKYKDSVLINTNIFKCKGSFTGSELDIINDLSESLSINQDKIVLIITDIINTNHTTSAVFYNSILKIHQTY